MRRARPRKVEPDWIPTFGGAIEALRALVADADSDHHAEPDDLRVSVRRKSIERAREIVERIKR